MFGKTEGGVEVEVQTITPGQAERMLEGNGDNRRIRQGTVDRYARDMAAGNWKFNGDAIRFNGDGTLLDGQHRLRACVVANTEFKTLVITGLSSETKATLDTGAKRTMTDVLRWRGETSQALLASTIAWCMRYETGRIGVAGFTPSYSEQLEWFDANPGIRESINIGRQVREHVLIPATILGGIHYETSLVDHADADSFMEQLKDGVGLEPGSPILVLRNWAVRTGGRRDRPTSVVYAAVVIKAVNAWREGRTITAIAWRAGGAKAEKFPTITNENIESS